MTTGEAAKTLHGTAVAVDGIGVLLLGPSGSGKSDLALRMILRAGASLIADDKVGLVPREGSLHLVPPEAARGLLEVRGLGIAEFPFKTFVRLGLTVQLISCDPPGSDLERLPEPDEWSSFGITAPMIRLDPFEISAVEKLSLAVHARRRILGGS